MTRGDGDQHPGGLQETPGTGGVLEQRLRREQTSATTAAAAIGAASPSPKSPPPTSAAVPMVLSAMPNFSGAQSDIELLALWLRGKQSHHTRLYYKRHAEAFLAHLKERARSLRAASLADVQDFADVRPGSDASRATAINAIKSLLSFAHKTGYTPFNVGVAVQTPKAPRNVAERVLAEADVQRMLAMEHNPRNHALLRLLYASGARCSELCSLRWCDVTARETGCQITVLGKGDQVRSILLSEATWDVLVRLRGQTEPTSEGYVFVSRQRSNQKGQGINPRQVERIVRAAAKRAGIQ